VLRAFPGLRPPAPSPPPLGRAPRPALPVDGAARRGRPALPEPASLEPVLPEPALPEPARGVLPRLSFRGRPAPDRSPSRGGRPSSGRGGSDSLMTNSRRNTSSQSARRVDKILQRDHLIGGPAEVKMSGGVLLSHAVPRAVPSALRGLASGFGMGPGVSLLLWPPKRYRVFDHVDFKLQSPTVSREPHSGRVASL
jgi:hypothetical protein